MSTDHEDDHKMIEQKALIYSMAFGMMFLVGLLILQFYLIVRLIEMA